MSCLWHFFSHHIVVPFEASVLKEVRILRFLHNNIAVLYQSSKIIKLLCTTVILHKLSQLKFLIITFLHSLYCDCHTLFFINEFLKSQTVWNKWKHQRHSRANKQTKLGRNFKKLQIVRWNMPFILWSVQYLTYSMTFNIRLNNHRKDIRR